MRRLYHKRDLAVQRYLPISSETELLVEKILAARLIEIREIRRPARYDLLWLNTGLKLSDRFRIADEEKQFRRIKVLGI
jgi:hypothetical protein